MNILNTLKSQECCDKPSCESPNLLETFKRKKLRLQEQLDNVNAVISALEANPEINTLLELIAKAR